MKTSEQIRDMEFQKATMGGYKQSDVELFLEEVASQIELLTKQKNDAEKKLQEISKKAPEASLSTAGIQNVLVSAQRVADQIIEDANKSAETIVADANLKLKEAEVKSAEIIAEAEEKAILLGRTAEEEATKIVAAATEDAKVVIIEAKETVELEQKLYNRLKIEVSDFKKKAAAQCGALIELINQLPGEISFNLERSKTVLALDFSDPEQLLKNAVAEKLAKENIVVEEAVEEPIETVEEKDDTEPVLTVEEPVECEVKPAEEAIVIPDEFTVNKKLFENEEEEPAAVVALNSVELAEDTQLTPEDADEQAGDDEQISLGDAFKVSEPEKTSKGRISFGEEDDDDTVYVDDDDDDDEPRFFFKKKKK